jgi:hypothetical protein
MWRFCLAVVTVLHPAAADLVQGRVIEDGSGIPISGAVVSVFNNSRRIGDLETDRQGDFRVRSLASGEYRLEITKANHAAAAVRLRAKAPDALVPDNPAGTLLVRLPRNGEISGRLSDLQGLPIREAAVVVLAKPFGDRFFRLWGSAAHPDPTGSYRLPNLPIGRYVVGVVFAQSSGLRLTRGFVPYPNNAQPREFIVSSGERYLDIDFANLGGVSYSVSGHLEGAIAGDTPSIALKSADSPAVLVAQSLAKDGSFRIENILPGSYELTASSGLSRTGTAKPVFGRTHLDLSGDVDNLTLALYPQQPVTFALRPSVSTAICGTSASIALAPLDMSRPDMRVTYQIGANAPASPYLRPSLYAFSAMSLNGFCYAITDSVLSLDDASKPVIVPVVLAPAGQIHGTVMASPGTDSRSTSVEPGEGRPKEFIALLVPLSTTDTSTIRVVFVDSARQFAFTDLQPGQYCVRVLPANGSAQHWLPETGHAPDPTIVAAGSTIEVSLEAPRN